MEATGASDEVRRKASEDGEGLSADASNDASNELEGDADATGGKNKNTKLQEKNRLAQRRFRERQKVRVNTLQQQIEELTHTVKQLTVEKHDLDTRNSLLESVLTVKDEQLRVMRERGHVMSQKIKEVGGANSGTITIYGPENQQIAVVLASERLADDNRLLLAMTDMYGIYIKRLQKYVAAVDAGDPDGSAIHNLDQTLVALIQQIETVEKEGSSTLLKWMVQSHDNHAKKFEGSKWMEELYDSVVRTISMTPEQASQLWDLYQTYLSNLRDMLQERIRVQSLTTTDASELTGIYSIKRATDFLQSQEAVAMYKDGLLRQQNVLFDLFRTVCRGVLSPIQTSKMLIASFPVMADVIYLAKAAKKAYPHVNNVAQVVANQLPAT